MTFRLTPPVKKLYRTTLAMVEFLESPQSQSLTHGNEQYPTEISIKLDDSLYQSHPTDTGILEVEFTGMGFARNSVYFGGILFNVSSLSLWLPSSAADLDISYRYSVIPRQTKRIVRGDLVNKFIQFIAFEFNSQLTRIDDYAFRYISELRSICLPQFVKIISDQAFGACTNLSSLTFERNSRLIQIEKEAFWACSSLSSIRLPASLQSIYHNAFPWASVSQVRLKKAVSISVFREIS
jgi:hypothetical protein